MKLTPRDIEITEQFLDYCNPISLSNDCRKTVAESGEVFYDIFWTAKIGDIEAEASSPFTAMKEVLEKIQREKEATK